MVALEIEGHRARLQKVPAGFRSESWRGGGEFTAADPGENPDHGGRADAEQRLPFSVFVPQ
jgi:hypothetical protein